MSTSQDLIRYNYYNDGDGDGQNIVVDGTLTVTNLNITDIASTIEVF